MPPPENVTDGTETYPVPPAVIETGPTPPVDDCLGAIGVALKRAFAVFLGAIHEMFGVAVSQNQTSPIEGVVALTCECGTNP